MSHDQDPFKGRAENYDAESIKCQWHGPSVIFGMMYPHVNPGESLLDLGIGTGLGARLFHKAGLKIYGLDSSDSMLVVCRKNHSSFNLMKHDLQAMPWPYDNSSFNHVISVGVIHLISDLHAVLLEISRIMKPGGFFGFDYYPYYSSNPDNFLELKKGIYEYYNAEYDHYCYRHSPDYIARLLTELRFSMITETEFLASKDQKKYFKTVISRH
nr:class I SAM-dependent methyltransferase [candidate division Zixibacteria bacterium]